jgi:hypothetical protein
MRSSARHTVAAAVIILTVAACGDSDTDTDLTGPVDGVDTTSQPARSPEGTTGGEFCEAMAHLIELLAPSGPTSPHDTEAIFTEAATWFAQADGAAPDVLDADFHNYAAAYDEYTHYLSTVDFNLDAVFATPEGEQLAIDTSHTMTPTIVEYVTGTCGLSFGEETHEPPEADPNQP